MSQPKVCIMRRSKEFKTSDSVAIKSPKYQTDETSDVLLVVQFQV